MCFESPFGVRIVRFPLACWSASMASNRDLKFPAPKPCGEIMNLNYSFGSKVHPVPNTAVTETE